MFALLLEQQREQVQRDGMICVPLEHPAIDFLGLREAAGLELRESGFDLAFDRGACVGFRFGRRSLGV